jgi:uncharacterized OB-fold protein
MENAIPVAEGLFNWPADEPRLMGSTCRECGTTTFPAQDACPRCCAEAMEERGLSRRGTLWTYTVQGFRPEPYAGPEEFVPYGVGYVELPDEVIVESRLTVADPEQLEIGKPMELVFETFRRNAEGTDVVTFAFAPSDTGGAP